MVADDVTMQIDDVSAVMILIWFACNNPGPSRLGLNNRYGITDKVVLQTYVAMLQRWHPFPQWYQEDSKPYSKVHGANKGPIWGRQDPGGSHVGPMNFYSGVEIATKNFHSKFK